MRARKHSCYTKDLLIRLSAEPADMSLVECICQWDSLFQSLAKFWIQNGRDGTCNPGARQPLFSVLPQVALHGGGRRDADGVESAQRVWPNYTLSKDKVGS